MTHKEDGRRTTDDGPDGARDGPSCTYEGHLDYGFGWASVDLPPAWLGVLGWDVRRPLVVCREEGRIVITQGAGPKTGDGRRETEDGRTGVEA